MTTPSNYHAPIYSNYTKVPNSLLADPNLSPAAKMRYCTIAQYIDIGGWTFHRQHLANELGVSIKKGARLDQELMLAGYMRKAQYRVKGIYTESYYALYSERRSTDGLNLRAAFSDADKMQAYFLAAKPLPNRDRESDNGAPLSGAPLPNAHTKIETINTHINDDDVLCLQAQPTEVTEPLDLSGFMDNSTAMIDAVCQLVEWDGKSLIYFDSNKQDAWDLSVKMLVALCLRSEAIIQRLNCLHQHGILPREVLDRCVEIYAQRVSAQDIRSPGRYMQAIIDDCLSKNPDDWEEL